MSFERKIAGQGLADVKAPTIAPTDEQKSGTLTIVGGGPAVSDRGHKNWGQTIHHQFELRSLMGTALFKNLAATPGSYELDLGAFGYHTVRSAGATLAITLAKPDGVPTSQHNKDGGFRHRQRRAFVEVFYPEDTTVSFSSDFAFTTAAWKADLWEQPDLALLVGGDEPITYAMLAKGILPQRLDELLAEGPRLAGTSDLFFISYNERTGKATVVLLSGPAGMEGMDPEVPDPDATEPVGEPPTPTPPPWEKPKLAPGSPDPDTQYDYTDPVTGLPLVPTPPPAATGTLYALHGASVSVSDNGGNTWGAVNVTGAGTLVDIVATPAGIFLLDDAGQVFTAQDISQPFQLVQIADTSTAEVEIPLVNGNFETGDLTGWTSLGIDTPRVLRTTQPPQLPGSTYYLTRDWRIFNPQPYRIAQTVTVPEGATDLVATVQCYCAAPDQIGKLRVTSQDDVAVPTGRNTFNEDNVCLNFARSPAGEELDLYVTSGAMGVFDGNNGSTGTRTFELRRRDGTIYDRPVFISIGDLDSFEEMRIPADKVVAWFAQPGSAFNTFTTAGLRYFTTTGENQNGGIILTDGAFSIYFKTIASSIGISGAPRPEWINRTTVEAVASLTGEWHELRAPLPNAAGSTILIELIAEGDPADVYFDDVRLTSAQEVQAPQVLAMGSVEGQAGGAELYLDGGILRYVADPEERGATIEVPSPDITMADHAPNGVRVASNGSQAWVWVDGWSEPVGNGEFAFTDVVCDPFLAYVTSTGGVFSETWSAELGSGLWRASGDRRREAVLLTESTTGSTKSVVVGGTITDGAQQPVAAGAVQRRSLATDSGRILGWSVGSPDLLWTSDLTVPWKVAGALVAPIIKIVEWR